LHFFSWNYSRWEASLHLVRQCRTVHSCRNNHYWAFQIKKRIKPKI
jgi:hypothetical protein